ncbi:hypothetical protein KAW48_01345 [candidate division WOR-3 bacterium]|nr:hypothetical protein [candidate division WOR-3 bacterium]
MKLIAEIKKIEKKSKSKDIPGQPNRYKLRVKVKNTIHPSLSLPKGIGRKISTIEREWVYPFIPKVGSAIAVEGKELGINDVTLTLSSNPLSATFLPESGGRIIELEYRNNTIKSPLLYGRNAALDSAGIHEDLGENTKMESWKFDVKKQSKKSAILECKKKGWEITKKVLINKNILSQGFRIKRLGKKEKVDLSFQETLSFIPDIHNLAIHIPTEEKVFLFTPYPFVSPWETREHHYGLKNGFIVELNNTVMLWSTKMDDIEEIQIWNEEWLININTYWKKRSIKKGKTKRFNSICIFGEEFQIDDNRIGIKSEGEWIWVKDGKLTN